MADSPKLTAIIPSLLATPEGQAAFRAGNPMFAPDRLATLALKKGLITQGDLNSAQVLDPDGTVHTRESVPLAAKLAIGGIGLATGGALLSGAGGAAAATGAGTAGTTAAAAAPLVTKAATSSWLAPLIGAGASTIGTIAGAKIAANANSDAAKIQSADTAKALAAAQEEQAYKRKQFADYQARLQPYQQQGAAAFANLSDILGRAGIPNVRN